MRVPGKFGPMVKPELVWTVSKALTKYQPSMKVPETSCTGRRGETEREQIARQFDTTLFHVVEASLQNSAVFTSVFVNVIVGLSSLVFFTFFTPFKSNRY